ncbi:MAG TPA: GNAT family N-acetyltransferase [Gammaproteobacteria bacterium]
MRGLLGLLKKLCRRSTDLIQPLFDYSAFSICILDLEKINLDNTLDIREFKEYSLEIDNIYSETGQKKYYTGEQLISRFSNGLYFYLIQDGSRCMATAWMHPKGERFVDEAGYILKAAGHSIWLRDVYVTPEYRGRGIFSDFIKQIAKQYYPAASFMFSDLETNNLKSRNAHKHCGFKFIAAFKVYHLLSSLMIRSPIEPDSQLISVFGYKPEKRICITCQTYSRFRAENLA